MQTDSFSKLFPRTATLHSYFPPWLCWKLRKVRYADLRPPPPPAWYTSPPPSLDTSWPCGSYHASEVGTNPVSCRQSTLPGSPMVSVTVAFEPFRTFPPCCRTAPETKMGSVKRNSWDRGLERSYYVLCLSSVWKRVYYRTGSLFSPQTPLITKLSGSLTCRTSLQLTTTGKQQNQF